MDVLLDEQPRARRADLSRVRAERTDDLPRGEVQVGVAEHQAGRLAAEFEGQRNDPLRRDPPDHSTGPDRAGERDLPDGLMPHDRLAHLGPGPEDDIEHARGEPGFGRDAGQQDGRLAADLGRLQDDGVPGGERRRHRASRLVQREIPRRDDADDAVRLASGEVVLVVLDVDHVADRQVHQPRVELEVRGGVLDLAQRGMAWLAGVLDLQIGKRRSVLADPVADGGEDPSSLGRGVVSPARRRLRRRPGGGVDIGGGAGGHVDRRPAGRRVDAAHI